MSLAGEDRKRKILDLLGEKGKVQVAELSLLFDVSTETIRRDLDELERDGKLKKVYGGAIKTKVEIELPHSQRQYMNAEAKMKIGKFAAGLIEDNDVIAIDEGSTGLQIIHHLEHVRNVTVMTSSIPAMLLLIECQKKAAFHGRIILIGGEVNSQHLRIAGPIAENMMDNYYVNKSFISVDGISPEHGLTSYDPERALFTRKLIHCSQYTIVLSDHTKLGLRTVAKIARWHEINAVVCDERPPGEWHDALKSNEVKWYAPEAEAGS